VRSHFALAAVCAVTLLGCGSARQTPAAAGCAAAPRSTTVPGAPLDTILRVPAANRSRRVPLVIALHFATGTGQAMERATGLTPEARRAGFDIAYPTATSPSGFWTPPDLPRLRRTISAIERTACIDARRVYLVGWSNGGTAAVRAACELPGTIAAVVLFAAAVNAARSCTPSHTPSLLEIHGTADPLWPYARGRAFVTAWARDNGCRGPTSTRVGSRGTRLRWTGCKDGATLVHLRASGARHVELLSDLRAAGIDPDDMAWRFLSAHPSAAERQRRPKLSPSRLSQRSWRRAGTG
jgi:polyhydroxybutyrate depolymerase